MLGSPTLYSEGTRIMMFQLSGFYYIHIYIVGFLGKVGYYIIILYILYEYINFGSVDTSWLKDLWERGFSEVETSNSAPKPEYWALVKGPKSSCHNGDLQYPIMLW